MTNPFQPGTLVIVTLCEPREKFWGMLLRLSARGLALCGVDLNSFEDFARLASTGEASPGTVFFPMHRVERMEVDAPSGDIPSLAQRFESISQLDALSVLLPGTLELAPNGIPADTL